jgi:15-cis-phytoene synthase
VTAIKSDACEALVREADTDRFLSALFAPAERRRALFALYAFNVEIASVRERVSAPLPGEVRLQWWRDVLEGRSEAGGHPVATAICRAVSHHRLPVAALLDLIDARTFDLYDDPMRTLDDLVVYARRTSSALIALAMRILEPAESEHLDAAGPAGVAYAISGLLRALPWHASRGQVFLPEEVLARHGVSREEFLAATVSTGLLDAIAELRAEALRQLAGARDALATLPETLVPAVLPVAVTRNYLDRMERPDYAPFATAVEVPQWRRQWAMWRAARAPWRIAAR